MIRKMKGEEAHAAWKLKKKDFKTQAEVQLQQKLEN